MKPLRVTVPLKATEYFSVLMFIVHELYKVFPTCHSLDEE